MYGNHILPCVLESPLFLIGLTSSDMTGDPSDVSHRRRQCEANFCFGRIADKGSITSEVRDRGTRQRYAKHVSAPSHSIHLRLSFRLLPPPALPFRPPCPPPPAPSYDFALWPVACQEPRRASCSAVAACDSEKRMLQPPRVSVGTLDSCCRRIWYAKLYSFCAQSIPTWCLISRSGGRARLPRFTSECRHGMHPRSSALSYIRTSVMAHDHSAAAAFYSASYTSALILPVLFYY